MSDIPSKLRAWAPLIASGYECPAASTAMLEAANEIMRLRTALKPFANFCTAIDGTEAGRLAPTSQVIHAGLTVGSFRNAAAALGDPTPQPMEKVKG